MPRRATRHWRAVTAVAVAFGAGRAGVRAIATFSKLTLPGFCIGVRAPAHSLIGTYVIQREDTR